MKSFILKEGIFWVGAVDYNPPKFGPSLSKGTTYNSYLISDEKTALIDTVKHGFTQELVSRISDAIDISKIDYIVIGNYQMDHSGSLPFLMKRAKNAKIVTTEGSKKAIEKYHGSKWEFEIVSDGDLINLGRTTLLFKEFKLNDCDLLLTYSIEDRILFSGDLFSQHIASPKRTDIDIKDLEYDALSYFVNYLRPLSELPNLKDVKILAPNHGAVWIKDAKNIIQKYEDWIKRESKNKAIIIYGSTWRGTEKMAYAIADGIGSVGAEIEVINYENFDLENILVKIFESKSIVIGCPSFKNGVPFELSKLLYNLKHLKLENRLLTLFTCYSFKESPITSLLELTSNLGFELFDPPLEIKYMPNEEEINLCFELGTKIGEKTKSNKSK
ncbi:MAG TPA: FprA family A-type flavoprotein [Methanofastidiosum sp.]|nr:FprA family A-type flavoprotein [Methanofastidiosum sp.]HQF89695.1 FprA family A-type flavoprotein [Methanofastidiosum sp.]HQG61571.1 FprA family A-type flavoprotein [Methanofastidiosum sp.]HQK85534.1 FprA family A-type flavoprotein [Methanofastidiosum sp.]